MDDIDVAQRRQQEEIDQTLAQRKPAVAGLTHCERMDCGEPITVFRQHLGARLCIDCALAAEREAQRWAPRALG